MTKKWYSLFSGRGRKTKNFTSKNMKLKKKKCFKRFHNQKKKKKKNNCYRKGICSLKM